MSKRTTKSDAPTPAPRKRAAKPAADGTAAAPKPRARKKAAPAIEPPAADDRPTGPVNHTPTHEEIATRAYYIALERGFSSDPAADWLAAERELTGKNA
jgi:hypothetical protein